MTEDETQSEKTDDHFFDDATPEEYMVNQKPISTIPVLPELGIALGILFLVFGISLLPGSVPATVSAPTEDTRVERTITPAEATKPANLDVYEEIALRAESAFVWDVRNQKALFSKNAETPKPLASVTKLMTALVAYELLQPEDRIVISEAAIRTEGDSGFVEGEAFTMEDLANITLVSSSNDGAAALGSNAAQVIDESLNAQQVFVEAMNIKAEELGLSRTVFKNNTGLDISETEVGAEGTAREMALLMEYIILNNPDIISLTSLDESFVYNESGDYHRSKNTNSTVSEIDGLIASKTGYTTLAGGNLVIAFNAGLDRPIIVSVLGSSYSERFSDTLALVEKTRAYINQE